MADTVQITMEKMVPELEDLQARRLFSAAEIRQIVDRRRGFEYSLQRVPLRKIDAMRYVEYELKLDALRAARKERLGLVKVTLGDTAGVKRVHNIFDRVLFKHRGSVELWLQYVAFCKREGSSRVLSAVFSRALQSHPRSAELWIEAASYEFGVNLNVDSARVLMQRAIRLNKHHQKLWLEYFRLELLYVQKLAMRRQVLRLDEEVEKPEDDGSTVLIDELPEEKGAAEEDMSEEMAAKMNARKLVLQGAIAKIVYTNAVAAIAEDVEFRLKFVEIRDLFGALTAAELSDFILEDCLQKFPQSEEVHAAKALRPFLAVEDSDAARSGVSSEVDGANVSETERQAELLVVHNFETSVAQLDTISMKELFADWLVTRLASSSQTAFLLEYARAKLKEFAFSASSSTSPSLAIKYVDLIHRTDGTNDALMVVRKVCDECLPQSSEVWLLQSQLVLHGDHEEASTSRSPSAKRRRTSRGSYSKANITNPLSTAVSVLKTALTKIATDDFNAQFAIHNRLVQLLISSAESSSVIEKAFKAALDAQKRGSAHWSAVRQQYVTWASSAASARTLEQVRALYTKFMVDEQLLPSPETQSFLSLCVDIETSATSVNVAQVQKLFEKLVELFGSEQEEVWVQYVRCLSERLALFADATRVQQRALRVWKESPALTQFAFTGL
ncbi:U3 small nucleolar RNA-associated protein 6 [Phytophthora cinnamomi]|uniref:U3 small nucleolar RNA-associated protein 6 n=1 Tax=Phytophthora cinnamomi TaxID=4785 RepID=UPI00355A5514|nr:U3 small nucleolar RNA-associated protein 6 [Phytophthora cinnamomi]